MPYVRSIYVVCPGGNAVLLNQIKGMTTTKNNVEGAKQTNKLHYYLILKIIQTYFASLFLTHRFIKRIPFLLDSVNGISH